MGSAPLSHYWRRRPVRNIASEAVTKGWTVVSMKDDWNTIFPPTNHTLDQ